MCMLEVSIVPLYSTFRLEFWFVWHYCFVLFFNSDYVYSYSNITSSFVFKGHDFMGVHYFTLHINTSHGKIIMKIMENLFIYFFSIRQLQNVAPYLQGPSWSYCRWIYCYLCDQCLSPLTLRVRIPPRRGVLDTTLCDKACQWLATGRWFSPGTLVSSTNKTDCHEITKILLKVELNIINPSTTTLHDST